MENILPNRLEVVEINSKITQSFLTDVLECFSKNGPEKFLPCWWLYDEMGSKFFEEITEVPEYYLTGCELSILKAHSEALINQLKPETVILEFGSGSSKKTRTIIEAFIKIHKKCTYIPIDISGEMLVQSANELLVDYNELKVIALHGTYDDALKYIAANWAEKSKLLLFLGSSVGNLKLSEALIFLKKIRESFTPNDKLLIGIDLMKDEQILKPAYHDPGLITEKFMLNLLTRMNRELDANFNLSNFKLEIELQHSRENDVGRIESYIKSLQDQSFKIDGKEFQLRKDERIHIENSHKYHRFEIDNMAQSAGFAVEEQWLDPEKKYTLNMFVPSKSTTEVSNILANLKQSWAFEDFLFHDILIPEALYQRPIVIRHPFIFYFGHITAFAKNQIFRHTMKRKSDTEDFDLFFERGIDPLVDDPSKCHKHSADINQSEWPPLKDLAEYKDNTRKMIEQNIKEVLLQEGELMSQKGRVFTMVSEHALMHVETLLYMIQVTDDRFKQKISLEKLNYDFQKSGIANKKSIKIPAGIAKIGTDFHKSTWGWDNEFPSYEEFVDGFEMDEIPITNLEYIEFIESGQYDNPNNWQPNDWEWKEKNNKKHPSSIKKVNGKWMVPTALNSFISIDEAQNCPMYCSHSEASAYAKYHGKRLPTEAEYMRAAYGFPEESLAQFQNTEKKHPWGNEDPVPGYHGNFNFYSWAPGPVGAYPYGRSAWGIYELVGNGWEWTSTVFQGLPGFEKTIPSYEGYSADFFDGHHYVMLGASWATGKGLIRRSFRNWFQKHYEFMFTKFRCVKSHKISD